MQINLVVDVDTSGLDDVAARLPKLSAAIRAAAYRIQELAGNAIKTGAKTGRTYKIGTKTRKLKTGGKKANALSAMGLKGNADAATGKTTFTVGYKLHRASAKGQAPATDTGNLANSIQAKPINRFLWEVAVGEEYGEILEERRDRPFLRPAVDEVRPAFEAAVRDVFKEAAE